jgi:hypothetical protein
MSAHYKPCAIVPLLVEQPTWGGTYIAHSKAISDQQVASTKYGQSYELAGETVLTDSFSVPPMYSTTSPDLRSQTYHHASDTTTTLQELIATDPHGILGKRVVERHGQKMPLLIKFTQAQENSYQVHVTQDNAGVWQPKPESWYFFEDGKATLGLQDSDTHAYKARCVAIEAEALRLSQLVKNGQQTVESARQRSCIFICF